MAQGFAQRVVVAIWDSVGVGFWAEGARCDFGFFVLATFACVAVCTQRPFSSPSSLGFLVYTLRESAMELIVPIVLIVPKSVSVRNPERSRFHRVKVKPEPKSAEELIQELASFREQTTEFFADIRGLGSTGLNPKSVYDTASITAEDLEEVWGKVTTYRTTNTKLHPETRRELIALYSKIYGTEDVTNNEFMMWVVRGFILECKGDAVDWATAAASTAREKADRCQRELDKCKLPDAENSQGLGSEGAAAGSCGSPPVYSFANQSGKQVTKPVTKPVVKVGSGRKGAPTNPSKMSSTLSQDRCTISRADLAAVQDVLKVELQLLESANSKVLSLSESRKKEADRIIGLRYSMDDRKSAAKESEESMKAIELTLSALDAEVSRATHAVSVTIHSFTQRFVTGFRIV